MKSPSKSIAESLRRQRSQGRGPELIEVDEITRRVKKPSMIAPGLGGVVPAPAGPDRCLDAQSAAIAAEPMKRWGG